MTLRAGWENPHSRQEPVRVMIIVTRASHIVQIFAIVSRA